MVLLKKKKKRNWKEEEEKSASESLHTVKNAAAVITVIDILAI